MKTIVVTQKSRNVKITFDHNGLSTIGYRLYQNNKQILFVPHNKCREICTSILLHEGSNVFHMTAVAKCIESTSKYIESISSNTVELIYQAEMNPPMNPPMNVGMEIE